MQPSPKYSLMGTPKSGSAVSDYFVSTRRICTLNLALASAALCLVVMGIVALALNNVPFMRFLRLIWQGIQIYPSWDFHPSPADPATGFLIPVNAQCRRGARSDYAHFEECAPELLDGATSTRARWSTRSRAPPAASYSPPSATLPSPKKSSTSASAAAKSTRRGLQAEPGAEGNKELSGSDSDDPSSGSDAYSEQDADANTAASSSRRDGTDKPSAGASATEGGAFSAASDTKGKLDGVKAEAGAAGPSTTTGPEKGQKAAKKASQKRLGFPSPAEPSQASEDIAGRTGTAGAAGDSEQEEVASDSQSAVLLPHTLKVVPAVPTQHAKTSRHPNSAAKLSFQHCVPGTPQESGCPVEWVSHITNCNLHNNRLARAVTSTRIPLAVLGLGTFWKKRWGYRMRLLHDYLVGVPEEKLLVVTDSADVIPVPSATPELVASRHQELVDMHEGPRVFFAAEIICYPRPQLWFHFPAPESIPKGKGSSPFKCLNAGIMVGPAGLIRRMLSLAYQQDCHDDQLLYSLAALDPFLWWKDPHSGAYQVASPSATHPDSIPPFAKPLIGLDHWNKLTVSMYAIEEDKFVVDVNRGSINLTVTNSLPLILHQSGPKSESRLLEDLARKFNYDWTEDKY